MRKHPFNGICGLARIGRAQNGHDPTITCHQNIPDVLKSAPDAVAPKPVQRLLRVFMVRVYRKNPAIQSGSGTQVAKFLQDCAQPKNRVKLLWVKRQI